MSGRKTPAAEAAIPIRRGTPPAEAPRELYTIPEACQALSVSHMTLYKYIDAGEIPVVRFGRNVRIRRGDLEAFIEAHVDADGKAPRQRRRKTARSA
ncbi:MAG TPA: helix-turn-helix domain-containing protein [Acidimicrobiales bacterium]|nr:helix-turn-helix domain-containing protein [Acidimicrobiales bacterium]